jgi:hypothetical protein
VNALRIITAAKLKKKGGKLLTGSIDQLVTRNEQKCCQNRCSETWGFFTINNSVLNFHINHAFPPIKYFLMGCTLDRNKQF